MKYKFKTEIKKEIEIELPYFFKLKNLVIPDSYFAILSENKAISSWRGSDLCINNYPEHIADMMFNIDAEEISKEEFQTILIQHCNQLINLI